MPNIVTKNNKKVHIIDVNSKEGAIFYKEKYIMGDGVVGGMDYHIMAHKYVGWYIDNKGKRKEKSFSTNSYNFSENNVRDFVINEITK